MKEITLELDEETIARLEEIGNGSASALSLEILGFALLEAYQKSKRFRVITVDVQSGEVTKRETTPRTFIELHAWADANGFCVEKRGQGYTYWRKSDCSTEGDARTIDKAYWDMANNF